MTEDADKPQRVRERLRSGWIDLYHDGDIWRISWTPNTGHRDHPGHTYSPADPDLPADYPGGGDPEALLAWGRKRWGDR
jgi:hypothetical protein